MVQPMDALRDRRIHPRGRIFVIKGTVVNAEWALQWTALAGLLLYIVVILVKSRLPRAAFHRLRRYVRLLFFLSLGMLLIKECGWSMYWIPSTSMSPTLVVGDIVLVNRHAYTLRDPFVSRLAWLHSAPRRGDIVTFRPPRHQSQMFIKRVIGLPGDRVSVLDKQWYVNGSRLEQRESGTVEDRRAGDAYGQPIWHEGEDPGYLITFQSQPDRVPVVDSWDVPQGHVFVLGDNRDRSEDSRSWGMLPMKSLLGKAERVLWNLSDPPEEQGIFSGGSVEVANKPN